jgi:hypothetical protein
LWAVTPVVIGIRGSAQKGFFSYFEPVGKTLTRIIMNVALIGRALQA